MIKDPNEVREKELEKVKEKMSMFENKEAAKEKLAQQASAIAKNKGKEKVADRVIPMGSIFKMVESRAFFLIKDDI
jgi:hypothetical protein